MKKVLLVPILRGEKEYIAIKYSFDPHLQKLLSSMKEVYWSHKHNYFYTPFSTEQKKLLFNRLRAQDYYVDYSALENFTSKIKQESSLSATDFNKEQRKTLHKYVAYLKGQRLSESSVRTYYYFILKLVAFIGDKPLNELVMRDLELFVEQKIASKNYAISTHRQCMSAIKHFLELHPEIQIDSLELRRPSKSKYLPSVLSKEEVVRLLTVTRNLKHRAILAIIYSSGLRIGELINLRLRDLDVERRQIFIKNSKGRKDRVVVMAESILPLLQNYMVTYTPKEYFTEGRNGEKYHAESIRAFLKDSCRRAGIIKKVTPHSLRHSYATHMLENGIDIRYIQALLGHSKPETTMIYTHVSRKDLMQITSPLDVTVRELRKANSQQGKSLPFEGS
ncbi:tyrosine-type recombinase/integrase [Salinimicrobium gaetbulicola]|uniref:Tyrosine-type recombinase/integrase n=1 Tax=Salinimicrobium gaetbulicola TaxID=999702 RepID=A0ABW3IF51_9FLAO